MIFRRRKLSVEPRTYENWLRAGRPPFEWFIQQESLVQDALAAIGDAVEADRWDALAAVASEPAAFQAGREAEADPGLSAALSAARALAEGIEKGIRPGQHTEQHTAPTGTAGVRSMAGAIRRRAERENARQAQKDAARSLGGRAPDTAVTDEPEPARTADQS